MANNEFPPAGDAAGKGFCHRAWAEVIHRHRAEYRSGDEDSKIAAETVDHEDGTEKTEHTSETKQTDSTQPDHNDTKDSVLPTGSEDGDKSSTFSSSCVDVDEYGSGRELDPDKGSPWTPKMEELVERLGKRDLKYGLQNLKSRARDGWMPEGSESASTEKQALDPHEDDGWEDLEPDVEEVKFKCLFDDETFTELPALLDYMRERYSFDLLVARRSLDLDHVETIQLINYIRSEVKNGVSSPDYSSKDLFVHEKYLMPTYEDDDLLFSIDDLDIASPEEQSGAADDLRSEAQTRSPEEQERALADFRRDMESSALRHNRRLSQQFPDQTFELPSKGDEEYFRSYDYRDVHEMMMKDKVRTDTFDQFIKRNQWLFRGKYVLDVGCGAGILAMMCARAGARVIGVERSQIYEAARKNVVANGFTDVIKIIHGRVEDIELPIENVDVIISEWMGYGLLYEGMLESVLWARDHYLAPNGVMVPSHAALYIACGSGGSYVESKINCWDNMYGFKMSGMLDNFWGEAQVDSCRMDSIASVVRPGLMPFKTFNLKSMDRSDILGWKGKFELRLHRAVPNIDLFVVWFDVFLARGNRACHTDPVNLAQFEAANKGCGFSTAPDCPWTHWQQLVLPVEPEDPMPLPAGATVHGAVEFLPHPESMRALMIKVTYFGTTMPSEGEPEVQDCSRCVWSLV